MNTFRRNNHHHQVILRSKVFLHKDRPKDSKTLTIRSLLRPRTNNLHQTLTHRHRRRRATGIRHNNRVMRHLHHQALHLAHHQHKRISRIDLQARRLVHHPSVGTKVSTDRTGQGCYRGEVLPVSYVHSRMLKFLEGRLCQNDFTSVLLAKKLSSVLSVLFKYIVPECIWRKQPQYMLSMQTFMSTNSVNADGMKTLLAKTLYKQGAESVNIDGRDQLIGR
jgi:hypothetical protein